MRRSTAILACMCAALLLPADETAAQIDNLTNMSAQWVRTSNRNAATDAADIVVYNPGGLPFLGDGFHLSLSNQTLFRRPRHELDLGPSAVQFEQDSDDWLLPSVYMAYVRRDWAFFGGVYVPGGGATVKYPQGSVNTQMIGLALTSLGLAAGFRDDSLEAGSLYLATTVGAARALGERVSLAAALRYLHARNTLEAEATFIDFAQSGTDQTLRIDVEETADGFGGVFGMHLRPAEGLDIGLRYESRVELEFETELHQDDFELRVPGQKSRRDFPAMLGLGASYALTPSVRAEADFNWFFQKQADWGQDAVGRDYAELAGDCYSAGGALAYAVNEKLLLSGGALYTKFLWDDIDGYYTSLGAFEVLYSDNVNLGAGLAYRLSDATRLNLGVAWTIWADETIGLQLAQPFGLAIDVNTENTTRLLSVGLDVSL